MSTEKKYNIQPLLSEYYKRLDAAGAKYNNRWQKSVIDRLKRYADTINPFAPGARRLFGVRADARLHGAVFMYGINPNTAFDPMYRRPSTAVVDGRYYHVYMTYPCRRWVTMHRRTQHLQSLGRPVLEFGVSEFFTHRRYTFGITQDGKRDVEAVHSTRNLAEIVQDTVDMDAILLESAQSLFGKGFEL